MLVQYTSLLPRHLSGTNTCQMLLLYYRVVILLLLGTSLVSSQQTNEAFL